MRRSVIIATLVGAATLAAAAKPPSSTSPNAPSVHKVHKSQPSAAPAPEPASQPAPVPSVVVSYQNGLLTITAQNVTLREVMNRVRESTGALVEVPALNERVTMHLGPQPPATVIAALLAGSAVNYVIVGGAGDGDALRAIQVTSTPAAGPDPPPPVPSPADIEAQAEAARARALFVAQTGGDEGVWDNAPEPAPAPAALPAAPSAATAPGQQ